VKGQQPRYGLEEAQLGKRDCQTVGTGHPQSLREQVYRPPSALRSTKNWNDEKDLAWTCDVNKFRPKENGEGPRAGGSQKSRTSETKAKSGRKIFPARAKRGNERVYLSARPGAPAAVGAGCRAASHKRVGPGKVQRGAPS